MCEPDPNATTNPDLLNCAQVQEPLTEEQIPVSDASSQEPLELPVDSSGGLVPDSERVLLLEQEATPSVSSQWAPLIYGRTYEIDFRFLVIPDDFDENDMQLIWEFIKVTTRSAEQLSGKPRWMFLRMKHRCVIGVTSLVRDLLGNQEQDGAEDFTRDRHGRPLYTFVGLVSESPQPTVIPGMDLRPFAHAYRQWIPRKWHERYASDAQQGGLQPLRADYYQDFQPKHQATLDPTRSEIPFEQLFPNYRSEIVLWNRGDAQNMLHSSTQCEEPIALCFGNLSRRDLMDSQFMSAAIYEVESRQVIEKQRKTVVIPPDVQYSSEVNHDVNRSSDTLYPSQIPEDARSFDVDVSSIPGNIFRFLQEGFDNVFENLSSQEIANLSAYQEQLLTELAEKSEHLKQLLVELQDLVARGRMEAARRLDYKIEFAQNSIRALEQRLRLIDSRLSRIRPAMLRSRQPQEPQQSASDPYLGWRQKEKLISNEDPESQIVPPEPSDPWQL